jgi:hypothetical protein
VQHTLAAGWGGTGAVAQHCVETERSLSARDWYGQAQMLGTGPAGGRRNGSGVRRSPMVRCDGP